MQLRLSFARESNTAVIVEQNDYYAFGLKHNAAAFNPAGLDYKYQYNGKEMQDEIGMLDYGARFYMPDLGRWGVVDPLAEISRRFSPYVYGNNNPVRFTDPDGRSAMDSFYDYHNFSNEFRPMLSVDSQGYMHTNSIYKQHKYIDASGSGGGGGAFGNTSAYRDFMTALQNGDSFSLKNVNGYLVWSTLDDSSNSMYYDTDGELTGTTGGVNFHRMKLSGDTNWYGFGGQANWFYGTGAVLTGFAGLVQSRSMYTQGYRRGLSANYQLTGRNLSQFGKMPMTSATVPASKIANGAKIAGHFSFGLGVITDIGGIMTGQVSFGKALLNTGFGAAGNWGGPIGASVGTVYFGVDNFYSGSGGNGWPGFFNGANTDQRMLDEGFNQAGPYKFHIMGAHEPK